MNMTMMKAMSSTKETSKMIQVPMAPEPQPNQIRIKVISAAVDTAFDDVLDRTLTGRFLHASGKPFVLGWHFSGTVEKCGDAVHDLLVGSDVWGHLQYAPDQKQGSFSEYITVPREDVAVKPSSVSHSVAAASATEAITALQAIRDVGFGGEISKNKQNDASQEEMTVPHKHKTVLILGAGGGVGIAAVQVAKQLGCTVLAVCSTKDVKRVRNAGADQVIDRRKQPDFLDSDDEGAFTKVDVILDTPSAYSYGQCHKHLNQNGCYVSTIPTLRLLFDMMGTFLFRSKKRCGMVMAHSSMKDLDLLGQWMKDGLVDLPIDSHFKISNLNDAIERRRDKSHVGQIVVDVEGGW